MNNDVEGNHLGRRINLNEEKYLIGTQSSYQVVSNDGNEVVLAEFTILQNENGIDIEDRIEKMRNIFETINKDS